MKSDKIIIYQVFTRLFGNKNSNCVPGGSLAENGCTKMNDIDEKTLRFIKYMGVTHVWYTGIIRHATQTDYSSHGIPRQHADVVKGKAGSPYAIADYYDVDPDLAVEVEHRMQEFEALVERTHRAGMKVIVDFVPNHVAREYKSVCKPEGVRDLGEDDDTDMHFSTNNNFYYCWEQPLDLSGIRRTSSLSPKGELSGVSSLSADYKEIPARATGNDQFSNHPGQNDWYETVKLNYGIDYCDAGGRSEHFSPIPNTWGKMTDILLFWAQKGIDGFRCDMAEMVPTAFWTWATDKLRFLYPEVVFVGEVYDPNQYRHYISAGFNYLYDKVGMYDCVRDVICGYRPASDITRQWQATDDIRHHMLYFLENHDEQRVASDFFAGNGWRGIPGLVVCALLMKNPFMLYAGQELGERGMDEEGFSGRDGRTTIFDYWQVGSTWRAYFNRRQLKKDEKSLMLEYQKVLLIATREKAVSQGDTFDLMYVNPAISERQYAFLRKAGDEMLLVVANFSDSEVSCDVVIPQHAFDFLQIPERTLSASDLMTGESQDFIMRPDAPLHMSIGKNTARVWKMSCRTISHLSTSSPIGN